MPQTDIRPKKITFARLGRALKSLGFECSQTDRFTAFRDAKHDALIILPVMRPAQEVDEPHLVAVRNTVTGKGVATAEQLRARLFDSEATKIRVGENTPLRRSTSPKSRSRVGRNRRTTG